MPVVKRFIFYVFIISVLLPGCIKLTFSSENINVRVLILAKYKPTTVIISHNKDILNRIIVNQKSTLPLQLSPAHEYQISLPDSGVKRSYAGTITIKKHKNYLQIINTVTLEDYVQSVVLSEIGLQHAEVMRAQAILARTWVMNHIKKNDIYDFNDLTDSQTYKGIFRNVKLKSNFLSSSHNQVLTYSNKPIKIFYHSDCANRSYSAYEIWGTNQYPYYKRIIFPEELHSRQPRKWMRKIKKSKINKIFRDILKLQDTVLYKRSIEQGRLGIQINNYWMDIDTFRIRINRVLGWNQLRSNHFSLSEKGGYLVFKGSGFGHLVGLCQKSAIKLAEKGWDHSRILDLFYPGTKLTHADKLY